MNAETILANSIDPKLDLKKISIDGLEVNYAVAGAGPNVILLHGANMGWGQWYNNISKLSGHFTVYALDLPGAGASTRINPKNLDFETQVVEIVRKFVINLKLQKVHIVAHSLGAWVALRLALKDSSLIDRLVLVSPLGFSKFNNPKQAMLGIYFLARLFSKTVMKPTRENIKSFLEGAMHQPIKLSDKFVDYYHQSITGNDFSHPFLLINRLSGFLRVKKEFVLLNQLSKIKHRVLIIMGDKDPIVPLDKHSEAFKLIPNSRTEVLLDSGHTPFIEETEKFNQSVIAFLTGK